MPGDYILLYTILQFFFCHSQWVTMSDYTDKVQEMCLRRELGTIVNVYMNSDRF